MSSWFDFVHLSAFAGMALHVACPGACMRGVTDRYERQMDLDAMIAVAVIMFIRIAQRTHAAT